MEETQERLTDENKAKINASNKQKHLADELERVTQQLEDEEEAKAALQTKLMQLTGQVCKDKIIDIDCFWPCNPTESTCCWLVYYL